MVFFHTFKVRLKVKMITILSPKAKTNISEYCLLITGCISPSPHVKNLTIQNAEERYRQYIDALIFYISETKIKNIVYCDNSNYLENKEIMQIARQYNKNFEWLSFQGDFKLVNKYGKGYGEGEIIEYALFNSKIIKTCSILVKVTGRLKVINIDRIIRHSNNNNYFFYITKRYCQKFVDTRFYIINKNDYINYFIKQYKNVRDSENIFIEHVFAKVIIKERLKYKHFIIEPNILGISGTNGKKYKSSKLKIFIKTFLNFFGISIDKLKHM